MRRPVHNFVGRPFFLNLNGKWGVKEVKGEWGPGGGGGDSLGGGGGIPRARRRRLLSQAKAKGSGRQSSGQLPSGNALWRHRARDDSLRDEFGVLLLSFLLEPWIKRSLCTMIFVRLRKIMRRRTESCAIKTRCSVI